MIKTKPLSYGELGLVTTSQYKYTEYKRLLGIEDLVHHNIPVPETSDTNIQDQTQYKLEFARKANLSNPFFVEHTALFIEGWNTLPGALINSFSASVGNAGLIRMLSDYHEEERKAVATVQIGFYHNDYGNRFFSGSVMGSIAGKASGEGGFGWDEIFIPDGFNHTFAELSAQEKDEISMRRKAVVKFNEFLEQRFVL